MYIQTEVVTTATNITLTKKEIEILVSAQKLLDEIWEELEAVDVLDNNDCRTIYNSIDDIGSSLEDIVNHVREEKK